MASTLASRRAQLWVMWAVCLAVVALELAVPRLVRARPDAWHAGETAVAGFVLALLALAAGVSTFATREALRDLREATPDPVPPAVFARARLMLLALWARCVLIGLLGGMLAYGSASPGAALPFVAGAAVLLVLHAPTPRLIARPRRQAESAG